MAIDLELGYDFLVVLSDTDTSYMAGSYNDIRNFYSMNSYRFNGRLENLPSTEVDIPYGRFAIVFFSDTSVRGNGFSLNFRAILSMYFQYSWLIVRYMELVNNNIHH